MRGAEGDPCFLADAPDILGDDKPVSLSERITGG